MKVRRPRGRDQISTDSSITVIAVYFLFLVGASVRASGAGMGCPDWPTCFGQWIPPTAESQLPSNYQEIYAERGYAETRFNVVKTWTEYFNRLVGATIGLLIFATAWISWPLRKYDRSIAIASIAAFFMVGFRAGSGPRSNLQPHDHHSYADGARDRRRADFCDGTGQERNYGIPADLFD